MKIKLIDIACTRSGDKGDSSNIGVIFNHVELYEWSLTSLTADAVKTFLSDVAKDEVVRYELPNLLALNFIVKGSLHGGGSESLLHDAQGKTHGQILLQMDLDIPDSLSKYVYKKNSDNDGF